MPDNDIEPATIAIPSLNAQHRPPGSRERTSAVFSRRDPDRLHIPIPQLQCHNVTHRAASLFFRCFDPVHDIPDLYRRVYSALHMPSPAKREGREADAQVCRPVEARSITLVLGKSSRRRRIHQLPPLRKIHPIDTQHMRERECLSASSSELGEVLLKVESRRSFGKARPNRCGL